MREIKKPRPPLVVDPDQKFLDELRKESGGARVAPILADTGKGAQLKLADTNQALAGLFVSIKTVNPGALSVIRFAHQYRPSLPIYVLYEGTLPITEQELKQLPVQKALPKPITYAQMMDLIAPAALFFDPKRALDPNAKPGDALDTEISAEDAAFLPLRAEDFLAGSKSFFDVYVRLNSGRYLKILQAGDAFTPDRVNNYLSKGVTHFYLRKEAQERYLGYCDQLTSTLLARDSAPVGLKISQTLNHGEQTMSFLRNQGISETNLQYAASFIENLQTLVVALEPGKQELLKGFLADVAAYEHGVATAMIAAMLVKQLGIEADRPVQVIGMAALFHDIALYRMDPEVREEDEAKMNEQQRGLYRTHPLTGAQMLRGIHGVDPAAVQAVAQHHERRNKKGFPARMGAGHINRIAEIVGISDEFARLIIRAQKNVGLNLLQEMELHVFDGFSHPILEAFRKVFFYQR